MQPGTRLGPYEVVAPLGAGGMGEVYRARDSKLGRDVAIKILPAAVGGDPERLARLQREAQVLASLNHSNIAHIYGLEEQALVMELVEGPTLAERIAQGPMPVEEALPLARQIAEALEYAHDKGIVHRDLKPANIKLTREGAVKVLDFGLAKAFSDDVTAGDISASPTLSLAATRAGLILGTAGYMAPEQAKGGSVDRRADIWSFGVVLFEMLSGKRLIDEPTASEALAAVLKSELNIGLLPPSTPPRIRRLVERCLQRDPRQRLQAIGEARIILDSPETEPTSAAPSVRHSALRTPHSATAAIVLLAIGFVAVAAIAWRATRPAPLQPLMRLSVEVGADATLERVRQNGLVALSPDGTRLAVTFRGKGGRPLLGTRLLNQSAITPLANTEDATTPFFSPDGQWIGFHADGKLKKISVDGGAAVTLCTVQALRGASWGDDGNIVFAAGATEGLSRVSSDGGTPVPLTKLKDGERTHRWPQVLPGSKAVLFTAHTGGGNYDQANIEIFTLKTGERKILQRGGFSGQYLPSGHLVYLHQTTLFAAPFDLDRLALTGAPVPILEDAGSTTTAGGDFAFSKTGSFVYLSGRAALSGWPISWLDSTGKKQVLHAPVALYFFPRLSPDGKRLAFSNASSQGADIWVKDLERDTPSRLTFLGGTNNFPVWTPDGKAIVFKSQDPANPGLYWIRSDGSGAAQRLTDGKSVDNPYSFSPDGKRLAFYRTSGNNLPDIWTAPIELVNAGDPSQPRLGKAELFLGSAFVEADPVFSPDGRWLAYYSNESGTAEVYVRPFPGPGGRWQISTGGGRFPTWSRSGHELLFEQLSNGNIQAVTYTIKGDTFAASTPKVWSAVRLLSTGVNPNYDLAPDGKRIATFLESENPEGQKALTHLTLLLNFFDELRRKSK